jgi:hypothetical protein
VTDGPAKKSKGKGGVPNQSPAWRYVFFHVLALIRQFGGTIIWAVVVIYLIHKGGETVQAFAGRTSVTNLGMDFAAKLNATITASVTLTGVTSLLWLNEYRRHRKTRERLTSRITELELRIDPRRESSRLTSQGTTQIGDL